MKVGDNVVALTDYKIINLKKGMTGIIKTIYNNNNKVIHWNDLNRTTFHHSHHDGLIFSKNIKSIPY
jgi:hypothetical protein